MHCMSHWLHTTPQLCNMTSAPRISIWYEIAISEPKMLAFPRLAWSSSIISNIQASWLGITPSIQAPQIANLSICPSMSFEIPFHLSAAIANILSIVKWSIKFYKKETNSRTQETKRIHKENLNHKVERTISFLIKFISRYRHVGTYQSNYTSSSLSWSWLSG